MTAKSFEEALEESLKEKLLYEKECICDQGEDGYFSCPYHDKYYDGRCMANWAREFTLKEAEAREADLVVKAHALAAERRDAKIATLSAQLAEARECLEFYANPSTYKVAITGCAEIELDMEDFPGTQYAGDKARAFLAKGKP